MNLDDLAERYMTSVSSDRSDFRKRARLLQSLWRHDRGYRAGTRSDKSPVELGSRLAMPCAKDDLLNYLTPRIREVIKSEVLDRDASRGKLYARPRIFNDLLSSQPLAFNLFAELKLDLPLCSQLIGALTAGAFTSARRLEFEYSPGRSNKTYTGDRSAFDVYIECRDRNGDPAFLGIEVKYHEDLKNPPAATTERLEEIAMQMGCFEMDQLERLKVRPLQQIWRDHLLAGSILLQRHFRSGAFVFLYPALNADCRDAIASYRSFLSSERSLLVWTLEDVVNQLKECGDFDWVALFEERYLAFDRIDRLLEMS